MYYNLDEGYYYSFDYDGNTYYGEFIKTIKKHGYVRYIFNIDGSEKIFNPLHFTLMN